MPKVIPDFITMTDERYSKPLPTAIKQALKFYPTAKFYVYGSDLSSETINELKKISKNVIVEDWALLYLPVSIKYGRRFVRMKALGMLRDVFLSYLSGNFENRSMESLFAKEEFEVKIQNKLRIIKHHNDQRQSLFIFMDADAFLINSIDELLDESFDIGVTIKSKDNQSFAFNHCNVMNVGVLLFLGNYKTNQAFIDAWYKAARETREQWSEQTSLSRLLHKLEPSFYKQTDIIHRLKINGAKVKVRALPTAIYNYTKIENFNLATDRDKIKVLHFKNSRFETPLFKKLASELGIKV